MTGNKNLHDESEFDWTFEDCYSSYSSYRSKLAGGTELSYVRLVYKRFFFVSV